MSGLPRGKWQLQAVPEQLWNAVWRLVEVKEDRFLVV